MIVWGGGGLKPPRHKLSRLEPAKNRVKVLECPVEPPHAFEQEVGQVLIEIYIYKDFDGTEVGIPGGESTPSPWTKNLNSRRGQQESVLEKSGRVRLLAQKHLQSHKKSV